MKKYIELEAAISAFANYLVATFGADSHRTALTAECILKPIPAAPVREVVRGTWIESHIPGEKYVCSECGGACWYYDYQGEVAKSRFCPNCGADMRQIESEDENV